MSLNWNCTSMKPTSSNISDDDDSVEQSSSNRKNCNDQRRRGDDRSPSPQRDRRRRSDDARSPTPPPPPSRNIKRRPMKNGRDETIKRRKTVKKEPISSEFIDDEAEEDPSVHATAEDDDLVSVESVVTDDDSTSVRSDQLATTKKKERAIQKVTTKTKKTTPEDDVQPGFWKQMIEGKSLTSDDARRNLDNLFLIGKTERCQDEDDEDDMMDTDVNREFRSVYSLLSRLDEEKCTIEFTMETDRETSVRKILYRVYWCLFRLVRFTKRHSIDLNIPDQCSIEVTCKFAKILEIVRLKESDAATSNAATEGALDDTDKRRLSQLLDDDRVTDREEVKKRTMMIIGNLDRETRSLLIRSGQVRGCKFSAELRKEPFAVLNCSGTGTDEIPYKDYAVTRMRYDHRSDDVAYMNGFYVISLTQRNHRSLKFPAYDDRFGHLSEIAQRYVKERMFSNEPLPEDVRVFFNLTTVQQCSDFNVLKQLPNATLETLRREDNIMAAVNTFGNAAVPATPAAKKLNGKSDPGGVLGLIQIGNIKYETKKSKSYIVVRGYIVATYSSSIE